MTNEEKAKEILKTFNFRSSHSGNKMYGFTLDRMKQMAAWKDEQFSKFLLWLDDYYVIRKFDDGEPMTYEELIDAFKNMDK